MKGHPNFTSALLYWSFSVFLLLTACIESFDPESIGYKNVLVIEGYISDQPEAHSIRLSKTRPLNDTGYNPETGARVSIVSDEGATLSLAEVSPGEYESEARAGVVGQSYILDIVTADGKHYQSVPMKLKETPPIDSVYFERDRRLTDDGTLLDGIKILLDAHDSTGNTEHFRYEWAETYEISVPYPAPYDYDPTSPILPIKPRELYGDCYRTVEGTSILIQSTAQLADARVSNLEINYVSTVDYKLRSVYSILVKQFALDETGYQYWSELQKNSESLGTLFDPLPYELRGNVSNVDDPDEAVLGYFDASSSAEVRLFVGEEQLRDLEYPAIGCTQLLDTVYYADIPLNLAAGKLISILGPYPAPYVLMAPLECADCRVFGSIEKPDFWPN